MLSLEEEEVRDPSPPCQCRAVLLQPVLSLKPLVCSFFLPHCQFLFLLLMFFFQGIATDAEWVRGDIFDEFVLDQEQQIAPAYIIELNQTNFKTMKRAWEDDASDLGLGIDNRSVLLLRESETQTKTLE